MKPYLLETEVWLPQPRQTVFDFFKNAENLQRITPPWLHFEILSSLPIEMAEGTLIDYRLRLYGVPVNWRTRIQLWQPPQRFVDVQIAGPYRLWQHTHIFAEHHGGTSMRDRVLYVPRGGLLAPLVNRGFVQRRLRQIFAFRKQQILAIFGDGLKETV